MMAASASADTPIPMPPRTTATGPMRSPMRSGRIGTPAAPIAESVRPQFASSPCHAVLTRGERATASRTRRAAAALAAPITRSVTSLVAPSPSRTIRSARRSHSRCSSASNRASVGPDTIGLFLACPLARHRTRSLGLVSPSTSIVLNVAAVTRLRTAWSTRGATAASVVMKASIVAIWGWIMPDPLAIPPTVMDTRPVVSRSATSLGAVSVVRIAAAAAGPPPGDNCAAARAIPPRTRSIGSRAPITPVEATSTSASSRPSARAVSAVIAFASSSPGAPVHAFAHPLLITTARARPRLRRA